MKPALLNGIELPIIQAPMAGVQDWELALAVARGGGLGSIPCGMLGVEQILQQVQRFREQSDAPFNLNFFCHAMPAVEPAVLRQWESLLSPYYAELGIALQADDSALRRPFSQEIADAIAPHAPAVLSFHFGLPSPSLVQQVKGWGATVLASATTLEEGLWLQERGADIVIAQGVEAGGHRGMFLSTDLSLQLPTAQLLEQLLSHLSLPVVAAGGIDSADRVAALLEKGASGVQVGTSYLLCTEAKTSDLQRELVRDRQAETALTNVFSGRPARGIRNRAMRELGDICPQAPAFPYAAAAMAPLRKAAEGRGLADFTPLWSGTRRDGCRAVSATELTRDLWPY
ncbi:MAG: nitronate monooxygenase [Halioglobus sp.]